VVQFAGHAVVREGVLHQREVAQVVFDDEHLEQRRVTGHDLGPSIGGAQR
jgi:hypothetical protein